MEAKVLKRWVVVGLAVAVGAVLIGGAEAATYKPEYKNSLVVGPVGPWGEAAIRFAEESPDPDITTLLNNVYKEPEE